ncbi:MAG: hypothetical protein ACLQLC_20615 [Candidatus Sulfotelmatobacter sp.]
MRWITVCCSILLFSALSFGQGADRGIPGYCPYGCGPFIPMLNTPMMSLTTVSPNPAGARNATGGLIAGATNSTLSEVNGDIDAVYTEPVWDSGGGLPLISPAVNSPVGGMHMLRRQHPEQPRGPVLEASAERESFHFVATQENVQSLEKASAATGARPAQRNYSNEDIQKLNEKNGTVHYDSKTEKIQ